MKQELDLLVLQLVHKAGACSADTRPRTPVAGSCSVTKEMSLVGPDLGVGALYELLPMGPLCAFP